ncbi:MAG: hypothetical protein KAH56_01870, partial [Candidatus Krumholzibacteria bacterium]|nr:hypothetical protein [Candidatus Krumholzibacteria bacterium]
MKPRPSHQSDENEDAGKGGPDISDKASSSDLEIDKKWIQRAQSDIEKFDFLYRKYRPRIFKSIMLNVKDEGMASNLTDETFSRAVDKLDSLKWRGFTFGAWLFKIARNVVALEYRRMKLKPEIPYDPDIHDPDNGNRPDLDMVKKEETHLLMMCVERLKPECREAISVSRQQRQ